MNWNLLYFVLKMLQQSWGGCRTCLSGIYRKERYSEWRYIVLEYEVLHTQSREYIVDDLLDVMKEKEVEV